MNCSQVEALIDGYLADELSAEQAAAVRAHLERCSACRGIAARDAALARQLRQEAAWRRRQLSPTAATRVQGGVYRRMRRRLVMQRTTQITGWAVAVAAIVALVVGVFALRQGGPSQETGGQDVPVGNQGGVTVVTFACQDYERGQFETLAREFEAANPDIRVQFVSVDEASGRQVEGNVITSEGKELERLTGAADTFIWYAVLNPTDWTFLLDLAPFISDPAFPTDDFYPGSLDPYRWKGGIYGLPARILPTFIFYDKTMFDAADVPYPHIGWTWDDFIEAATQLTQREGDTLTRYGFADSNLHSTLLAMAQQFSVALWDERADPPQPLFDTQAAADLLGRYTDLALHYEVMPGPEQDVTALINAGQVAMWTDAAFNRLYHAQRTQLGVAPFPEAAGAANPTTSYGFFVSVGTANPSAAWRWLSFLSASYQPSLEGSLPGRRSVTGNLSWWQGLDAETQAVYEYALEHALATNTLLNWPLAWAARDVLEDGVSVEEALASAQQQALGMQAELAAAQPESPHPVATPQPAPKTGQTVITFAPASNSDVTLYRELATRFQADHPDVWVEIVPPPSDLNELPTTSDCFAAPASTLPGLRQEVRSLQPLLDADPRFDLSDFYPQFLGPLQQDGQLWGLPYQADALMVYLNLARLAEVGITPPQPGWTMDDFWDAAVALSDGDRYGFTTREGAYGDLLFALERLGARLYDDPGAPPTPTFDDPTVVAALGQVADLSRGRALTPGTPSTQSGWPDGVTVGSHPTGVPTGEAAMWVDTIQNHVFAGPLPFEIGIAPLPVTSAQASTEFDVEAYFISSHSDAPQACWEWLTFLSGQPAVAELLPARRSVTASSEWQTKVGEANFLAYDATLEYADTSLFDLRWEMPWLGYTYPWLYEAFETTVAGEEPARASGEAQAKAKALVTCLEATAGFSNPDQLLTCARQVDPDYPLVEQNR